MLFAILLNDLPDKADIRSRYLAEHIAWLEQHKDIILIGGSLRQEPTETPQGGLWIAEAESRQQIDTLLQTDPFYRHGLRRSYQIFHWSKANPERKELI